MKKFLALALAVLMAFALVACGNAGTDVEAPANDGEAKVLKMATNAAFPPYEFNEGEEFVGIDV